VAEISDLLAAHERNSLLRFLMCGSVDDGKSTLIGRLLYETQALYADQLATLENDSRRAGTQNGELDFALLTDGLAAEREQGITIDVAYRHFSTEHRHFIVADAPGHEQYTRNMVTGASTADCAVILIDARLGVSRQTRRHSYLVALLGIEHIVVAVNKMDTVEYSSERFDEIQRSYAGVMARIEFSGEATCIPVSALRGVNILERSADTPWYEGPTLMEYLETVVEAELHRRGHHTYLLDGDNVRHGLNRDLGFTDADRVENIRRVAEVSRLMLDAGLIVIVSFISPFRSERQMARRLFDDGQFLEVFVDTPLAVAEERDTKGLYRKARAGDLANFTGIDSPYQPPEDPEIRLDTTSQTVDESVAAVLGALESRELVSPA
jgi:adenylyl-sulfate kinase